MSWVQTFSGRRVDLLKPDPASIHLGDVAHALANITRFNGHTPVPYSVAQHSFRCSQHFSINDPLALVALLHDAHEAYTGDITRPLKVLLGPELKRIERGLSQAIEMALAPWLVGKLVDLPQEVKNADLLELRHEARDLMGGEVEPWSFPEWVRLFPTPTETIQEWPPGLAKVAFMARYRELTR